MFVSNGKQNAVFIWIIIHKMYTHEFMLAFFNFINLQLNSIYINMLYIFSNTYM